MTHSLKICVHVESGTIVAGYSAVAPSWLPSKNNFVENVRFKSNANLSCSYLYFSFQFLLQLVLPEYGIHLFISLLLLAGGQWTAFLFNIPLIIYNIHRWPNVLIILFSNHIMFKKNSQDFPNFIVWLGSKSLGTSLLDGKWNWITLLCMCSTLIFEQTVHWDLKLFTEWNIKIRVNCHCQAKLRWTVI